MSKPKFVRWMSGTYKRLKPAWRRQHGLHGYVRIQRKGKQLKPSIGYGSPKSSRYLHPSKFREVRVHSLNDLGKIDPGKDAVKIASAVGKRKKGEIVKKAGEMKIKILNP